MLCNTLLFPRLGIWAGHPKSFIPESITNHLLSTLYVSAQSRASPGTVVINP